jgi:hypothetical protein
MRAIPPAHSLIERVITMTKQAKPVAPSTAYTLGVAFANREKAEFSDIEKLDGIVSKLSFADYEVFRADFKAGALSEGYQETAFNQLWSSKVLAPLKTLGVFPPVKPVTSEGAKANAKTREKKKAVVNELAGKTPKELEGMRATLTPAIIAGDEAALKKDLAIVQTLNKLRKASEKQAKTGEAAELRAMKAEIQSFLKTATRDQLQAILSTIHAKHAASVPTSTLAKKAA